MPFCAPVTRPADDHAFDHQVRQILQDEAIFDRARLALVGVADDVLFWPRLAPHERPFQFRRKSGAAHPAQVAGLQRCQHRVHIPRGGESLAGNAYFSAPG